MLGKRILGEQGAADARLKAKSAGGGGAIRLGRRLLSKQGPAAVPVVAAPKRSGASVGPPRSASANKVKPAEKVKGAPKSAKAQPLPGDPLPPISFTEAEVATMLDADPNSWSTVLAAEAVRPEGQRLSVAAMVLEVADRATDTPVPAKVRAYLEGILLASAGGAETQLDGDGQVVLVESPAAPTP